MKKSVMMRVAGVAALGILFSTAVAMAQPGSGGPTPTGGGATTVPIDGGASLLLASGVALSLKKLRDRKKLRDSRRPR